MKEDKGGIILSILYSIFAFTLFCVFMVLKLCGVIAWSWWVVTLPLWVMPAALIAFIAVLWIIYAVWLIVRKMRIKAIQRKLNNGNLLKAMVRKETAEKFAEKVNQAINAYRKKVGEDEYVIDARRLIFEVNGICKEFTK